MRTFFVILTVSCLLCLVDFTETAESSSTNRRTPTTTIRPKKPSVQKTPKKPSRPNSRSTTRLTTTQPPTTTTPMTTVTNTLPTTEETTESTTLETTTFTTTTEAVTTHLVIVMKTTSNASKNSSVEENDAAESTKITRVSDDALAKSTSRPSNRFNARDKHGASSKNTKNSHLRNSASVSHEIDHSKVSNIVSSHQKQGSKCLLQGIRCRNNSITCFGSGDIDCYAKKCSLTPSSQESLSCNGNLDEAGCSGKGVCVRPTTSVFLSSSVSSPLTTAEAVIVGVSISLGVIVLVSTCVYVYVT